MTFVVKTHLLVLAAGILPPFVRRPAPQTTGFAELASQQQSQGAREDGGQEGPKNLGPESHNALTGPVRIASHEDRSPDEKYANHKLQVGEYIHAAFSPVYFSNWTLAVIGVTGGALAFRTLLQIKRQANLMDDTVQVSHETLATLKLQSQVTQAQADHMQRQTELIKAQAELMGKQGKAARDRERARLSIVQVDEPVIGPIVRTNPDVVTLLIVMHMVNDGNSKAFDVRARGRVQLVHKDEDEGVERFWSPMQIPATIREIGPELPQRVVVTRLHGLSDTDERWVFKEQMDEVMRGDRRLAFEGAISYTDVFADRHETPFSYVWTLKGDETGGPWKSKCFWENCSGLSS